VVVRYFGGTKLGKGGLVRAYGGVVQDALAVLATRTVRPQVRYRLRAPYDRLGALRRLLRPGRVELAAERFGAELELEVVVDLEARAAFDEALAELGIVGEAV